MTGIRKQIIVLIEPYMDKTLSEGCYILQNSSYYTYISNIKYLNQFYNTVDDVDKIGTCVSDKILGHYDITAIEKFIRNKGGEITHFCDKYIYINIYGENNETICIPNKPLHLYEEQEEKELLDLLLKLK